MYLITGKAKEAFLKNCKQTESFMNTYADIYLNALIIDWLDSVGIYILVTDFDGKDWWSEFNGYPVSFLGETRQQATQEAIKKAVEIYNKWAS